MSPVFSTYRAVNTNSSKQIPQYIASIFMRNPHYICATSLLSSSGVLLYYCFLAIAFYLPTRWFLPKHSSFWAMSWRSYMSYWLTDVTEINVNRCLCRYPFLFPYFSYIHLRYSGNTGRLTCVCVRIYVCLPLQKSYRRTKPSHTRTIFIQNLYKYRWITAVKES